MSPWYRYVIRFTIRPNARNLIDNAEAAVGVLAIHVQATPEIAAISDARHLVCSLHLARMPGSAHVLKVRGLSGRSLNTRKKAQWQPQEPPQQPPPRIIVATLPLGWVVVLPPREANTDISLLSLTLLHDGH
jgi:hypothetical protein